MDSKYWDGVKTGDLFIWADLYEGVFVAKVVEVDIAVFESGSTTMRGHPYGLTAETGAVKIEYTKVTAGNKVKQEKFENLGNLIVYDSGLLRVLRRKWNSYYSAKLDAEALEEDFNAKVQEYRSR